MKRNHLFGAFTVELPDPLLWVRISCIYIVYTKLIPFFGGSNFLGRMQFEITLLAMDA